MNRKCHINMNILMKQKTAWNQNLSGIVQLPMMLSWMFCKLVCAFQGGTEGEGEKVQEY